MSKHPIFPQIRLSFDPRDIWIGVYWRFKRSVESPYRDLRVYLCLLPMFPVRLRWEWGFREAMLWVLADGSDLLSDEPLTDEQIMRAHELALEEARKEDQP